MNAKHHQKVTRRLWSVVLTAALILSVLPYTNMTSMAATGINVPKNTEEKKFTLPTRLPPKQSDKVKPKVIGSDKEKEFADDRIIVRIAGSNSIQRSSTGSFYGIDVKKIKKLMNLNPKQIKESKSEYTSDSIQVITLKNKGISRVKQAIKQLNKTKGIVYAEPDYIVQTSSAPNDTLFNTPSMWGIKKIQAPKAWDTATGSQNVVVAVIDSGIDYRHPDLAANMWHNPGEIENDGIDNDQNGYVDDIYGWGQSNNKVFDEYGHGTHVAGIIGAAGNNSVGTAGINWNVKLMNLKVFDNYGQGYSSDIVSAIQYADMMNAPIVNGSYGGYSYSQAEKDAIDHMDALFVVAACNDAQNNDTVAAYPANYDSPNIISVAATAKDDTLASFSNYGGNTVDIAAPGEDIFSTTPLATYTVFSGTSMAAPHVAGAAALLLSHEPYLTTSGLKMRLLAGADMIPQLNGKVANSRRLNVYKAMYPNAAPLPTYIPDILPTLPPFTGFSGGDGTTDNPYQVSTPLQLNEIRNYPNSHFIQVNDIDMAYVTQNPNGILYNESRGFIPIDTFNGVYNGDGHVVRGLAIRYANWITVTGFIINNNGWIMNLGFEDGNITGWQVGGMAGYNLGVMANCYNTSPVTSYGGYAAGLVLGISDGETVNCYNTGTVTNYTEENGAIGGLSCWNTNSSIVNCYNTGNLLSPYIKNINGLYVGGIAAYDYSVIRNSYTTGTITTFSGTGMSPVSGITATVDTIVENSYCLGKNAGKGTGTILTQTQMRQIPYFVNWNFNQIWNISSGQNNGFPFLRLQAPIHGLKGVADFAGGDGSPQNPLQVSTPAQLDKIRENLNKFFIQTNDIDLTFDTQNANGLFYHNGKGWLPVGEQSNSISARTGLRSGYNGNGYNINGLKSDRTELESAGLFTMVSGTVEKVAMTNSYIRGGTFAGGITGYLEGVVKECYHSGYVESRLGGDYLYTGGIAGFMGHVNAMISDCYNTGDLYALSNTMCYLGGITGAMSSGLISNCYNVGTITGDSNTYGSQGVLDEEIAGYAYATVESCYRLGIYGQQSGTILTTDQMKQESSFEGWDFDSIWEISPDINTGYPHLRAFSYTQEALINAATPVITRQPSSLSVQLNQNAALSVEAVVSQGTISYQWMAYQNEAGAGGTMIQGASNASFTVPTGIAGTKYYNCIITNTDNTATGNKVTYVSSQIVSVTVSAPVPPQNAAIPLITKRPANLTARIDEYAALQISAWIPSGSLSYQWYEYAGPTSSGFPISGANQQIYLPSTNIQGTRYFCCVITNTDMSASGNNTASVTGNLISVTVNNLPNASVPEITQEPADITILPGAAASLHVSANVSHGTLSYQWYEYHYDGTSAITTIQGANSAAYIPPSNQTGTRYYFCTITNSDVTVSGSQSASASSRLTTVTVRN